MGSLKGRLDRIETALEDKTGERYRNLCFHYNLHLCDDLDLCEAALSIFEGRPMDPETEKRLYAPIPPDAPKHLIEQARRWRDTPAKFSDKTEEDWEQEYKELLEHKRKCIEAREWRLGFESKTQD